MSTSAADASGDPPGVQGTWRAHSASPWNTDSDSSQSATSHDEPMLDTTSTAFVTHTLQTCPIISMFPLEHAQSTSTAQLQRYKQIDRTRFKKWLYSVDLQGSSRVSEIFYDFVSDYEIACAARLIAPCIFQFSYVSRLTFTDPTHEYMVYLPMQYDTFSRVDIYHEYNMEQQRQRQQQRRQHQTPATNEHQNNSTDDAKQNHSSSAFSSSSSSSSETTTPTTSSSSSLPIYHPVLSLHGWHGEILLSSITTTYKEHEIAPQTHRNMMITLSFITRWTHTTTATPTKTSTSATIDVPYEFLRSADQLELRVSSSSSFLCANLERDYKREKHGRDK